MHDGSYTNNACEFLGGATSAAASVGSAAYNGASAAANSTANAAVSVHDWAQELSDPESGLYPYSSHRNTAWP